MAQFMSDRILTALRRITRAIDLHSRRLARGFGITGPQQVVLRAVASLESATMGALATAARLSNATVSGIVDRLESHGLVSRRRSEKDRRQVLVEATAAGLELLRDSPSPIQEAFTKRLAELEAWERTQTLASLERVAWMLDAEDVDAAPILASHPLTASETLLASTPAPDDADPATAKASSPAAEGASAAPDEPTCIDTLRSLEDFPPWLSPDELAAWLHNTMKPYEDLTEDIRRGIDHALAPPVGREPGFVLLAHRGHTLEGALVMVRTGMKGYVPENLLLFVGVGASTRGQGLGTRLVQTCVDTCEGAVKLHVEADNPARRVYERVGFKSKYVEMRYDA